MLKSFSFGRDKPASAKAENTRGDLVRFNTQREQLRVAIKETLRASGIPAAWVGGELLSAGNDQETMSVLLIVQEWHEELLRYLPALQSSILATLKQLDSALQIQENAVSWQFAADCGFPNKTLPRHVDWGQLSGVQALHNARQEALGESTQAPRSASAPTKPKFDLPVSDLDRLHATDRDPIPSTFAATETGFLATLPAPIGPGKSGSRP